MTATGRIAIVGGGVAAQRCAFKLRELGFAGAIELIGQEHEAPYDRTLLSKDMLTGADRMEPVSLRPRDDYAAAGIALRLGVRAVGLRADARELVLDDGSELGFEKLVICSGGRPFVPQALRCPGVLTLRELADLARLDDALERVRHLVVVGAGFVGCELAAAAVARNAPVTLVEAAAGPLAPLFGEAVAERVAALHRTAGVRVVCGTPVLGIERTADGFSVALADRPPLRADAVVVGVGMQPNVDWLHDSPVALDDGVLTDACCRTNVPGVLAAGDCARWLNPRYGARMRVEHWDTAAHHGEAAAVNALGGDEPFAPVPFFWSDQHGAKLQWVGHAPAWDELERCDEDAAGLEVRYRTAGQLGGVLCIDRPKALVRARKELLAMELKEASLTCHA
ncbi:MAG TPA: FAD-dependent oxidoreductase [Conexibacter sp.]|nr:FAD-dependent oxidoreductase [Conexibacter sp.]